MSALVPSPPVNATTTQRGLVSTAAQTFNGAKRGNVTILKIVANETVVDLSENNFFYLEADDKTIINPINAVAGQSGVIVVLANNSGEPIDISSDFLKPSGSSLLGGVDGTINTLSYFVVDVDSVATILCSIVQGYA